MSITSIIEAGGELIFGATDEGTAIVVPDYPYGRRVRTTIRYWLESRDRHGDRFVSQTMNPRTGLWNKPKRSTYTSVGVMYRQGETGHIKWTGLGTWPDADALADFCGHVGAERLNDTQKLNLARLIGRVEVFKHVKFTIREGERTPEEEAEQKAIEQRVWRAVAGRAKQAHDGLTQVVVADPDSGRETVVAETRRIDA